MKILRNMRDILEKSLRLDLKAYSLQLSEVNRLTLDEVEEKINGKAKAIIEFMLERMATPCDSVVEEAKKDLEQVFRTKPPAKGKRPAKGSKSQGNASSDGS